MNNGWWAIYGAIRSARSGFVTTKRVGKKYDIDTSQGVGAAQEIQPSAARARFSASNRRNISSSLKSAGQP
jgi:hypothetical protein